MDELAIETRGLRKIYGAKVAVENLTLQVRRGEVFGFLGPNGAGKSTSIKMLLGLASPAAGEARVLGRPAGDREARRKIGFLPEHFRFHDWLTAREFLRLHARLYGMAEAREDSLLELVGLVAHSEKRLRDFSKGMLQRIGLAQALLNNPDLIFLDEPTSGLDPAGRILVRDIIREQRSRGAAVFLNSHLLSEVEVTCDRVAFIRRGEVLAVRALGGAASGELTVSIRARNVRPEAAAGLDRWARTVDRDGNDFVLAVAGESVLPEILRHLIAAGADVYSFTSHRDSLEEQFIRIVGAEAGL